jgi:two-component system heavy metal sensor histidine kinase CusS
VKSLDLRNRIALIYLVSTGLLVGAVFLIIYWIAAETMERHFNDELMTEFAEVGASMSIQDERVYVIGPHEWTEQEHGSLEMSPVFLQATDTLGAVLRKSDNLKNLVLVTAPVRRDTFFTNTALAGGSIRQVQGPLCDYSGRLEGLLLVAVDRSEADMLLRYLRVVMILSLPVIVGIIFLISRLFGSQIVAPIRTVISTAERITEENLQERIPLPERRDELYRLAATINQLLDRLQEAVIREQQFTADAAHELRTPLAALKGTMDVLTRHTREPLQYVEKLKYLISEVNRMTLLVDQLLTLSRYESGAVKPRPELVELPQAVQSVIDRLEPLLVERKMTSRIDSADKAIVTSDALMLNTILENIISNAIKYSPEGRSIEIKISRVVEGVECLVIDHGVGMTDEQLQRVFQRFYRADESRASSVAGSGLGLSVVRRMADLLSLKLDVTSKKDKGTTFTILFPGDSDLIQFP